MSTVTPPRHITENLIILTVLQGVIETVKESHQSQRDFAKIVLLLFIVILDVYSSVEQKTVMKISINHFLRHKNTATTMQKRDNLG